MTYFKKGQRIVCHIEFEGVYSKSGLVVNHAIPTIHKIYTCDGYGSSNEAIYLKEINEINDFNIRCSFKAYKFRPLDESFMNKVVENINHSILHEKEKEKYACYDRNCINIHMPLSAGIKYGLNNLLAVSGFIYGQKYS